MENKLELFLIKEGLYGHGMNISNEDYNELSSFLEGEYKIDAYCNKCGTKRVFTSSYSHLRPPLSKAIYVDRPSPMLQEKYESLIKKYPDVKRVFSCAKHEDIN